MPVNPGDRLGQYEIVVALGRGAMGAVYLAHDSTLHRKVALKVIASAPDDPVSYEQLLREARNAAALNHPYICTIHEVQTAAGLSFITMEHVEGRTLRERLDRERLGLDAAVRYGIQAAEALAYAHAHGVVHRDFKAANILVTTDDRIKIVDFGLARRADVMVSGLTTAASIVPTGAVAGTPYAMAPEQVRGETADARADVWALGVLLHEMLAGSKPFDAPTTPELFSSILRDPPAVLPATVPDGVKEIVARCLEKDRGRRWRCADDVRDALGAAATHSAPGDAVRSVFTRSRVRRAVAVVLVIAAIVVGRNTHRVRGLWTGRADSAAAVRLAVLPFDNLTGDPEQEFFSDGLTDEMITQLGRLQPRRLSVIGRTSSMQYKKKAVAADQVGRELHVDYVLEGATRREGKRVRISVQLIRVKDQAQLWADIVDGDLSSAIDAQGAAARGVADSLKLALLPGEGFADSPRAVSADAYELYLRGKFHSVNLSAPELDAAMHYFEAAVQKEPRYALAQSGIAMVWLSRKQMGLTGMREGSRRAQDAAMKALALDSNLAEAHYVLSLIRGQERRWQDADAEFQRAIALNPAFPDAHAFRSHFLNFVGRRAEARAEIERAIEIDPLNPLFLALDAIDYLFEHRPDRAVARAREALRTAPGHPVALNGLWAASEVLHKPDEAIVYAAQYLRAVGQPATALAVEKAYGSGDYRAAMRAGADRLIADARTAFVVPTDVAQLAVSAGDNDRAFEWLLRGADEGDPNAVYIDVMNYDPLRNDPRFVTLRRRLSLPN